MVTAPANTVQAEIIRQRMQAAVEEMATIILRTGHTVFVKETSDFGAALVSPNYEVFATPLRLAVPTMCGRPTREALSALGDYQPGDVGITNDPYRSGGMCTHLPDLWLWQPVFHQGEIVCFALSFIHSSDVGGRAPGSIVPSASDLYQEGICIPPRKLIAGGVVDQGTVDLILANCRIPAQNWGDLKALLSGMASAERHIHSLIARYGVEAVRGAIDFSLDYAEDQARQIIREIPDGSYVFWDYMEGDILGEEAWRLKLTLTVAGDEIGLDFAGTELQVPAAFNLPTVSQRVHCSVIQCLVNFFVTLRPEIPFNSGLARPIRQSIPPGTILNPRPGAACGVRAATQFRILDLIQGALTQALPHQIPAAGAGQACIVLVACPDAHAGRIRVSVAQPLLGGSGGRPMLDGIDGVNFAAGWLRSIPNEALEADMPVLVEEHGLREDSAGAGEHRGGVGARFSLRLLHPDTRLTARGMERYRFHPWGRLGGRHGTLGETILETADGERRALGKIDVLDLNPGDVVTFLTQGGGGLGPPEARVPARVLTDVESGLVSAATAERDYGVVIRDGKIDQAATEARRRELAAARTAVAQEFDYGPARDRYEQLWSDDLVTAILDAVAPYPLAFQRFLKRRVEAELSAEFEATGRRPERAAVDAALTRVIHRAGLDVLTEMAAAPT